MMSSADSVCFRILSTMSVGSVIMVVDPWSSSTSILVMPPLMVGFRYFRSSASALSSPRRVYALLPPEVEPMEENGKKAS
jgi:hypothetical protein